jgi:hypothetical protein
MKARTLVIIAGELGGLGDARLLQREQHERIFAIDHGDGDHRHAFAAYDQDLIGAGDTELLPPATIWIAGKSEPPGWIETSSPAAS